MVISGVATAGSIAGGVSEVAFMIQLTVPSIFVSTIYGYSRELEQEADIRAVHALVDAGYSAGEMKNFFEVMQQDHDVDLSKKGFYQDHPKLQDRTRYVGDLAASLQPSTVSPAVEADRYLIE